jgi:hypothetical protein
MADHRADAEDRHRDGGDPRDRAANVVERHGADSLLAPAMRRQGGSAAASTAAGCRERRLVGWIKEER